MNCKYFEVALAEITHIVDTYLVGATTKLVPKPTEEQIRRLFASYGKYENYNHDHRKTYDPQILKELQISKGKLV